MFNFKIRKVTCTIWKLNINFKAGKWNLWIEERNESKLRGKIRLKLYKSKFIFNQSDNK